MPKASFLQTVFHGGEWSALAQGRMDSERYKTALNVCENYAPLEEGSLIRRSGFLYLTHTRHGSPGRLMGFDFSVVAPYQMEFTTGILRFFRGPQLLTAGSLPIASISSANPAVVQVGQPIPTEWDDDDTVIFEIVERDPCGSTFLCNRQFEIDNLDTVTNTFTLKDALTGIAVDGADIDYQPSLTETDTVKLVFELNTVYTGTTWEDNRLVQDEETALILNPAFKPYVVTEDAPFAITAVDFEDGPYLTENLTTTTLTPSGTSGSVTVTASSIVGINDGVGFLTTDVGRLIRFRGSPTAWNSGTTYAKGNTVIGTDSVVYTSLTDGNLNHNPITDVTNWAVSPTGIVWTWMKITARTNATVVVATIMGETLPNTNATRTWRLGLFSDTLGWPTCGAYHEGRLWLSGVAGNRADGSVSGESNRFNFAPTQIDGTVADNNAVTIEFKAKEVNDVFWMSSTDTGLIAGTQAGPWRMSASNLDDPITPTSRQARRISKDGCYNSEVVEAGNGLLFIQRKQRKLIEFTGKNAIQNLSLAGMQMSKNGLVEVMTQAEPNPTVWARRADGVLVGCSYKNEEQKSYAGWYKVLHGDDRYFKSISTGPTFDGRSESLYVVTNEEDNPDDGIHWVEMMQPPFDDDRADGEAWFVDGGVTPCCVTSDGVDVTFGGLWHLEGRTVTVSIGGLDIGDFLVTDGTIVAPLGTPAAFTQDFLDAAQDIDTGSGQYVINVDFGFTSASGTAGTSNTLVAYVEVSGAVVGVTGTTVAIDQPNGFIFDFNNGTGATDGIRKFGLGGNEIAVANLATLGVSEINDASGGSFFMGQNNLLYFVSDFNNTSVLASVTESLGGLVTLGTASATTAGTGMFAVYDMCTAQYISSENGLARTAVVTTTTLNNHAIGVFPTHNGLHYGSATAYALTMASSRPVLCHGRAQEGWAEVFVLEKPLYGAASATAHKLYRVTIGEDIEDGTSGTTPQPNTTAGLIGTIAPSVINAAWTQFSDCVGIAFDQEDGNILAQYQGTDGVTTTRYLVKLSTQDGSLVWKTVISNMDAFGDQNFTKHQITDHRYMYWDGAAGMKVFDTRTGSVTTTGHYTSGFTLTGGQVSDDRDAGMLVFFGSYSGASPVPSIVGPATGPTFTNQWMRLYAGLAHDTETHTFYSVPLAVGFNYTSRAQLLRPDYGNDAGTANGPAFGKTRRIQEFSAAVVRTQNISFGVDFSKLRQYRFKTAGGQAIADSTLVSGILNDKLEHAADYEGKIAWEQDRPYPGLITAVAGYLEGNDK